MERQQKPTAAERDYKVFRSASAYILGGACTCGNGHVYARTVLSETTGFCLFHCKTTDIKSDKM